MKYFDKQQESLKNPKRLRLRLRFKTVGVKVHMIRKTANICMGCNSYIRGHQPLGQCLIDRGAKGGGQRCSDKDTF